ncbi:glutamate carboxypeptidase [Cupriavidus basilensis OR16]|uniref:Glutamate carboxypeptidase n=1 Tax=Cupriavidus basilensis OR16 TaxID=1127483 RepID=H1S763_9BURK|nr:M20/M25/M40 family metallo-hydrolase [Cupriavidus basilensis]EHP41588.1 glutamate carboxypeptidase [Cupriavidus basilensis OR16]
MHSSLRRLTQAAIATLILATGSAHAADAQLLAAARTAEPSVIQSLKEMVSIESGSANAAGLAQMATYTEGRLATLGARTERIAVTKGPGIMVKGTLTGTGKRRIMLIAHMDTVYPANTLATQPIKQDGNRLYGPGIADDKGGIAVILHALAILQAAPELGRNALIELAYQLQQTRDVAKSVPGTQLNWTTAQAGEVRNQIPERATAIGDVRATVKGGPETLQAALQKKVDEGKLVPDTQTTVTMETGRPPFVANARGRELAHRAQAIYAELDGRQLALAEGTGGATDAGFAGRSGKAVVVESFGLAGFGYHARDEYIEIDSIVPRLYLLTRILQEIGRS